MSFILVPQNGEHVQVNGWNWRPTLEVLYRQNLITLERYERLGANGCGGQVDAELALRMAQAVERTLNAMEVNVNDLYSAGYEWPATFRDFCRVSEGFQVR